MIKQLAITAALCCSVVHSQTPSAVPVDFPAGAQAPNAAQLAERLGGQVFTAKLANGVTWRMDYKSSGYLFFDVSTGQRDTAKWRTEDGRLCLEFRGAFPSGCTEFRTSDDRLYLKRSSTGEVVALDRK